MGPKGTPNLAMCRPKCNANRMSNTALTGLGGVASGLYYTDALTLP